MSKATYIYSYEEIIARLIQRLELIAPLSGYRYEIGMYADNSTQPPVITVKVWYHDENEFVYEYVIDQNTTLEEFEFWLHHIGDVVDTCNLAYADDITYQEALEKKRQQEEERIKNLPF